MAEAMIELDVSAPWEPPDDRERVPGRSRRWGMGAAVLALVCAVLPAGQAPRDLTPLYTADFQVMSLDAAGGRLIVSRYQAGGAPPVVEAIDARDGRTLWERPTEADQSFVALTDEVALLQVERADEQGEYDGRIIALDAASGRMRWERRRTRIAGLAGGLVLAEDQAWPGEEQGFDPAYGDPEDPAVVLPMLPHHERRVALEPGTGRVVWTVDTPPGVVASLTYGDYPQVDELSELDAAGVLRVRDLATGGVAATFRLGRSGAVGMHRRGVAGQEVVWAAGARGADVYDRGSGRLLWHAPADGSAYNGPFPCLPDRYCVFGESGTDVLDPGAGARQWRAEGYAAMLGAVDGRLLLYRQGPQQFHPDDVTAFDPRTGAVAWHEQGWQFANGMFKGPGLAGYFVWRPTSNTDAVVGRLDPRDGHVEVIGRAADFYGSPQCTATGGMLACLAIGVLYVWALP
ncbi:PQQ-binding-like beta-propeller repeat protein [Dactylosporangium sp. CA-139066]|uniref:outer membrane protein assembly factor BamB family protein n=1 Tax=Dactylosporangium sp. CA-139066 TaxID=3239930 RepID=UPI003D8E8A8E